MSGTLPWMPAALVSAYHADGRIHRPRHDTDRTDGVLGTNGLRDHGRLVGRDDSNADLPAYIVCCLVQGRGKIVAFILDSGIAI